MRTKLIARARIDRELDEGANGKLTCVIAPAGFGKTIVVAQWIERANWPVAWFSIDGFDNNPRSFWNYVVAALSPILQGLEERFSQFFRATNSVALENVITALIDEFIQYAADFILVLDDYHFVEEIAIHESLSLLIKYLPANAHLIIISRSQLPFSSVRLQTGGQVKEIRVSDLQFTADEIAELCQVRGIPLSSEGLHELESQTEGWPVGLSLLLDSVASGSISLPKLPVGFHLGTHRVACYLTDEVMNLWGEEERSFMLKTSILTSMSGSLCNALTGRADGQEMLERLARHNAFVTVLDQEGGWYRYHHLFGEYLQQRLDRGDECVRRTLHAQAGSWYQRNGYYREAVRQYLQGGAYEQAAALVEEKGREMLKAGDMSTLVGWLGSLPVEVVGSRILLSLTYAWTLVIADMVAEAKTWIRKAEQRLAEIGAGLAEDWKKQLEGEVLALNGFIGLKQQDPESTSQYLIKFQSLMPQGSIFLAFGVNFNMGEASLLGGIFAMKGHLQVAEQRFPQIYEQTRSKIRSPIGFIPVLMGEMLFERNRLDEAVPLLMKGVEEAEVTGTVGCIVPVTITLARVMKAKGDIRGAFAVLQDGEKKLKRTGSIHLLPILAAFEARINLEIRNTEAVEGWMRRNCLDLFASPSIPKMYEYITLARVFLARKEYEYCQLILSRLSIFAQREDNLLYILEILNLQAIVQNAIGQTQRAMKVLRQSLQYGEQHGYERIFIEEGAPMSALLRRFIRSGHGQESDQPPLYSAVSPSYVRKLIKGTRTYCITIKHYLGQSAGAQASSPHLKESLTKREKDVLRLLDSELTNAEIAYTLDISVNTVKVNCGNIYRKLGAKNRYQAVGNAKGLGILG